MAPRAHWILLTPGLFEERIIAIRKRGHNVKALNKRLRRLEDLFSPPAQEEERSLGVIGAHCTFGWHASSSVERR
jgi:hypothetical protein